MGRRRVAVSQFNDDARSSLERIQLDRRSNQEPGARRTVAERRFFGHRVAHTDECPGSRYQLYELAGRSVLPLGRHAAFEPVILHKAACDRTHTTYRCRYNTYLLAVQLCADDTFKKIAKRAVGRYVQSADY